MTSYYNMRIRPVPINENKIISIIIILKQRKAIGFGDPSAEMYFLSSNFSQILVKRDHIQDRSVEIQMTL